MSDRKLPKPLPHKGDRTQPTPHRRTRFHKQRDAKEATPSILAEAHRLTISDEDLVMQRRIDAGSYLGGLAANEAYEREEAERRIIAAQRTKQLELIKSAMGPNRPIYQKIDEFISRNFAVSRDPYQRVFPQMKMPGDQITHEGRSTYDGQTTVNYLDRYDPIKVWPVWMATQRRDEVVKVPRFESVPLMGNVRNGEKRVSTQRAIGYFVYPGDATKNDPRAGTIWAIDANKYGTNGDTAFLPDDEDKSVHMWQLSDAELRKGPVGAMDFHPGTAIPKPVVAGSVAVRDYVHSSEHLGDLEDQNLKDMLAAAPKQKVKLAAERWGQLFEHAIINDGGSILKADSFPDPYFPPPPTASAAPVSVTLGPTVGTTWPPPASGPTSALPPRP